MNTFICPICKCENEAYVEGLGSDMIMDLEKQCSECGYEFSKTDELNIYSEINQDQMGSMIDRAMDLRQER